MCMHVESMHKTVALVIVPRQVPDPSLADLFAIARSMQLQGSGGGILLVTCGQETNSLYSMPQN